MAKTVKCADYTFVTRCITHWQEKEDKTRGKQTIVWLDGVRVVWVDGHHGTALAEALEDV